MPASRKHTLSDWGSDIDARIRAAHVTKAALAQQLSLHPSTLFRWLQSAPPSEFERRRVETVLGQFEGVRPGSMPDRLMGYERDSVGDHLRSLVDDLRKSRKDLARALSQGKDGVPIHDAVYWLNRILAITEDTVAVRDAVIEMIGALPIAVYHFGPDLNIRWITAGATTLFGWTPDEIVQKGAMWFIHPDDLPRSTEALSELASRGAYDPFEVRIRCKDGSYKTVTARGLGIFGDDAKLRGIVAALM